jgi:hypothetical protein
MATKADQIRRAKMIAQEKRIKRIIAYHVENGEFPFAVELLPDSSRSLCDQLCRVTIAGEESEITVKEMLALHETAACACGLEGCLSRGTHGPKQDLDCDAQIASEALEYLRSKTIVT